MRIKLGDICAINELSLGSKIAFSKLKYLDTSSITNGIITKIQEFYYPFENIPSRAQRKVKDKTIIYSTVRPRLRHFGILHNPDENLIVSTGFITIDVNKKFADPIYIYNLLRDEKITNYFGTIADTAVSSYPSISPNDLRNLEIEILDDMVKQKEIGEFFNSIDSKIEINNKINAELESMAKTLYDYWFLQFEFPNEEGKPYKSSGGKMVWNGELKKEIPEGWKINTLSEISDMYQPKTFDSKKLDEGGKYRVYGAGGYMGQYNNYSHEQSEIFISCRGSCGNIYKSMPNSLITGNAMIVNSKMDYLSEYLFLTLKIFGVKNCITGSVQPQITRESLNDWKFTSPYYNIIDKFNSIIKPMSNKQELIIDENQELTSLRDYLLPLLMNGQVTFK
jgi:type I restriction enzyme S subunit